MEKKSCLGDPEPTYCSSSISCDILSTSLQQISKDGDHTIKITMERPQEEDVSSLVLVIISASLFAGKKAISGDKKVEPELFV